jgi:hypothetical protein
VLAGFTPHREVACGVRTRTQAVPAGTKVSIEFELHPEGLTPPRAVLLPLEWANGGKVRHVLSDDLDDLKASIEKITGS